MVSRPSEKCVTYRTVLLIMRHISRIHADFTDDELLAEVFADVADDVRGKSGIDPDARYQFLSAFMNLANRTVERDSRSVQ